MPDTPPPQIVVAGNIGLDLIPRFDDRSSSRINPGAEVIVGSALRCTGGAVANAGLALHRLGVPVALVSKVGGDWFGGEVQRLLTAHEPTLARGIVIAPEEDTSYTVVISPRGVDRTFLHCPGASDSFGPADVRWDTLRGARMFHFGYPPCMRGMFSDGGRNMAAIFTEAKRRGMVTSLDMCGIDPASEAGTTDWRSWLERVLPLVDIFLPSLDEIHVMLRLAAPPEQPSLELLSELADELIRLGTAVAVLKLGDRGLYLRSSPSAQRLPELLRPRGAWVERELYTPCFQVDVAGTTGSGDATIAGFLAAALRGSPPELCLEMATAVGACSVEAPDAISGLRSWDDTARRITEGWPKRPPAYDGEPTGHGVLRGPHDGSTQRLVSR